MVIGSAMRTTDEFRRLGGALELQRQRFVELYMAAADAAGLPDDAAFVRR